MASSRTSRSSSTTRTVFAGLTMIFGAPSENGPGTGSLRRGAPKPVAAAPLPARMPVSGGRMHAWDAGHYLRFADERTRPALDLLARVDLAAPCRIVDL